VLASDVTRAGTFDAELLLAEWSKEVVEHVTVRIKVCNERNLLL
jgi:hypothetical protein